MPSRTRPILAAAVLAAGSAGTQAQVPPQPPQPQNQLSLSASATTEVTMDLLGITFSTTREGPDAAGVQAQLKQALDAALAEARRVAKPGQVEVRTGNFSLYPRYAPKAGGISGWQGSAQLQVQGRDTQAISQLAGRINTLSIQNVGYSLSREAREKVEAETTAQAIARFREQAQAQAALFGFAGYQIREVNVGTQAPNMPRPVQMRGTRAMSSASDEALPVEAGKAEVSTTVNGTVMMTK